ncbi:MAG: hypothetical protein ACT4PJ_00600 [Gemmatimonadaceae bacterium]
MKRFPFIGAMLFLGAGCREGTERLPRAHSSDVVVDSAFPAKTLLRRFQSDLERPAELSSAAPSREALTRRYLDAIARSDTNALRGMHISKAEYAFLYFPESRMMDPPYELPPDVAWLLLSAESSKGMTAILRRFGARRFQLESVRCPGDTLREGPNVVWRDCVVRYRGEGDDAHELRFFAAIIQRNGQFKFFSYGTPL